MMLMPLESLTGVPFADVKHKQLECVAHVSVHLYCSGIHIYNSACAHVLSETWLKAVYVCTCI